MEGRGSWRCMEVREEDTPDEKERKVRLAEVLDVC